MFVCDYCQNPDATIINEVGYLFHESCAIEYARSYGGLGENPLSSFERIRIPEGGR